MASDGDAEMWLPSHGSVELNDEAKWIKSTGYLQTAFVSRGGEILS